MNRKQNNPNTKLLELIFEFNKIRGYKINIKKSIVFYILAMDTWAQKLKI